MLALAEHRAAATPATPDSSPPRTPRRYRRPSDASQDTCMMISTAHHAETTPKARLLPKIDPVAYGARMALTCAYAAPSGGRIEKENCTLADIRSGRFQVLSVDPAVFDDPLVIPVVILYAGIGGMSLGIVNCLNDSPFTYFLTQIFSDNPGALSSEPP